jgi:hypothetical protein
VTYAAGNQSDDRGATSAVTASRRVAVADMAKSSIGIAESLAGLSPSTIFELRGEWRRLLRRRRRFFRRCAKIAAVPSIDQGNR